jgi:serine protease Do
MTTNNLWELAEAILDGKLTALEMEQVENRKLTEPSFADELQENINLIKSLRSSGKQTRFKATLTDIHKKQTKRKQAFGIQLPPYVLRTTAIAAGVALVVSFANYMSLLHSNGKRNEEYSTISREVEHIKKDVQKQKEQQKALIDSIAKNEMSSVPPSEVRYTGTGFALTNDGYFVTAYHVINDGNGDCDSVYIESDGTYYKANLINVDSKADLAILKVERKGFHFSATDLPYTFQDKKASLGAKLFTIGYPKNAVVYSEGYVSGRNGYDDNELQYTLELPAGHGQSGSPVADSKGNIVGVLTAIGSPKQANTYAVSSAALLDLVHTLPNYKALKLPKGNRLAKLDRESQVELLEHYTFSVKVYKK